MKQLAPSLKYIAEIIEKHDPYNIEVMFEELEPIIGKIRNKSNRTGKV